MCVEFRASCEIIYQKQTILQKYFLGVIIRQVTEENLCLSMTVDLDVKFVKNEEHQGVELHHALKQSSQITFD